jgi:primosomal protein N'
MKKLEALGHRQATDQELAQFDEETEQLLIHTFGTSDKRIETYKYASLGEAETMVNLPESAQEQTAQDVPKKAIQQRRQVLEGIVSELQNSEETEEKALTGEDHEDPPMM